MEPVTVRVYYDFASTLCYVAHRVLETVREEIDGIGVDLEWRPIDLTEAAPWDRGDSFTDEIRTSIREVAAQLGIDVEMPDPWLDSRPASEIALQLDTRSAESRWRNAVFDTFFRLGEPYLTTELDALAVQLMTDPAADFENYPRVRDSTREAFALGVTGVPTMLLDHWAFGGIHDGPSMVAILEQLADKHRELGTSVVN